MPIVFWAILKNLVNDFKQDRTAVVVFTYLLLLDAAFIAVHIFLWMLKEKGIDIGFLSDVHFSLLKDQGYGEWFDYAKIVFASGLLLCVWWERRQAIYMVLSFIFALVVIDDSMAVHEAGGHLLLGWVSRDTSLGLHMRDLGELAVWALLGSFALALFVYGYRKSQPEDASIGVYFAVCLALLIVFAIGVDMLHAVAPTRALDGLFGIIEEGGEMVVLSLACALTVFVFRHWQRGRGGISPATCQGRFSHSASGAESGELLRDPGRDFQVEVNVRVKPTHASRPLATPYVPKPFTSGAKADGRYAKDDFVYLPTEDAYRCPAGETLPRRFSSVEEGRTMITYFSTRCGDCALKSRCTPAKERRVRRWEHEAVVDAMLARLEHASEAMTVRRRTVEHPFATLKAWMGATHFLTKGLERVRTEMSLHVLAYNMKRVIKLLGVRPLIAAMRS